MKFPHKKRKLDIIEIVIAGILLFLVAVSNSSAQNGVVINSATATCNSVQIQYSILNFPVASQQTVYIDVFMGGNSVSNTPTIQVGGNTNHSLTINFPQQTTGTNLYVTVDIPNHGGDQLNLGACSDAPTTVGNPGGGNNSSNSNSTTSAAMILPPWSGYSDGRLNPDPAEAYSVWCAYDKLFVHGEDPNVTTRIVAIIDLYVLDAMRTNDEIDLNYMKISRQGDTIVVQGNNGHYEPNWASKTFSFSACLANNIANGGTEDLSAPPPTPNQSRPLTHLAKICYNTIEALQRANADPSKLCSDGPTKGTISIRLN